MEPEKVFAMKFSKVYPLLVAKAERKGRSKEEVDKIICWMTGYSDEGLANALENEVSYQTFFEKAPELNPNRMKVTGSICGIRVEAIADPLMKEIRILDKMVDELAKGKVMEKILRN